VIRYLIDTNVVSEMRKRKPHGAALAWLQSLELGQVFFSAVTFGEIQKGVEVTRQQDPVKANEIAAWAAQLERAAQVLPMDAACFREYARLMQGRSETLAEDAMIAATARVHGLTVATRNERDFAHFDVAVFNPFRAGRPRERG
jgi:predicted nucleic acid-binding protein